MKFLLKSKSEKMLTIWTMNIGDGYNFDIHSISNKMVVISSFLNIIKL